MKFGLVLLTQLLFATTPLMSQSQPTPAVDVAAVDRLITNAMSQFGASGVSVALVKDGSVVLSKGYGVRDISTRQPMTNETVVPIFSIAKQFTSFAGALLADEKKFTFNAPLRTYFNAFETSDPISTSTITLRDLLSHRSGLPELTFLERDKSLTRQQAVMRLRHLRGMASPRSSWSYSNYGYAMAAQIIETAAGMRFEDFVEKRIFEPLQMTQSTYSYEVAAANPNHLRPIVIQEGKPVMLPLPRQSNLNAGAGGIYSTADDMAAWMLLQLSRGKHGNQQLINPETLAYTHLPAYAFGPGTRAPAIVRVGYGLGWYESVFRGYPMSYHGGYTPGVNTFEALLPHHRIGVVVFTNHDLPPFAEGLTYALVDHLLGIDSTSWLAESLREQRAIQASMASAQEVQARSRVADTRPGHQLQEYGGTYFHPGYGNVNIRADDNKLSIEWADYPSPLAHWHYDVFQTTTPDQSSVWAPGGSRAEVRFLTNFRGEVSALQIGGLTGVSGVTFEKQGQ